MEEKSDKLKRENEDKMKQLHEKGIYSTEGAFLKKSGIAKKKLYLTPRRENSDAMKTVNNIKVRMGENSN